MEICHLRIISPEIFKKNAMISVKKIVNKLIAQSFNVLSDNRVYIESILDFFNDYIKKLALKLEKDINGTIKVFSATIKYDNEAMWAYYAKNKGICIEYNLPNKVKNIFKISYSSEKITFALEMLLMSIMKYYDDRNSQEIKRAFTAFYTLLLDKTLKKSRCWSTENEYRIVSLTSNKIYGIEISKIFIDEELYKCKSKILKNLFDICLKDGIPIFIRYFDSKNEKYYYDKKVTALNESLKVNNPDLIIHINSIIAK